MLDGMEGGRHARRSDSGRRGRISREPRALGNVRGGDPARELVKEANEQHAAAIAIGGHHHSAIGGALVHSVAASLIHEFAGSLVIVRGELSAIGPDRSR